MKQIHVPVHQETASNALIYDYANQLNGKIVLNFLSRQVFVCFRYDYPVHVCVHVFTFIIIKRMNLPNHLIMTLLHFYFLINP